MLRAAALMTLVSVFLFVSTALAAPVRAGADDAWRAEQRQQRAESLWEAAVRGGALGAPSLAAPGLGDSLAGLLSRRLAPAGFGGLRSAARADAYVLEYRGSGMPVVLAGLAQVDLYGEAGDGDGDGDGDDGDGDGDGDGAGDQASQGGASGQGKGGSAQSAATQASPRQSAAERELEIRDSVGATASELAKSLVRQRVKLKRSKRALGAGVAGLIFGPLAIVGGVVLILTIIGLIAGVILVVIGAVSTVLGIPLIIGGAIGAGAARNRIDVLEEKLKMKGELWEPRAQPLFQLALRF